MSHATIYHPRVISIAGSPYCELARWVLDRLAIPYVEESHAPVLHTLATRRFGGGATVPVLDTGEAVLLDARQVVDYYEARCPVPQKLFPSEGNARAEARQLFDFLLDTFGVAARAWAYAYMLPRRETTERAWLERVPWWEGLVVKAFYPLLASSLRRRLKLRADTIAEQERVIEAAWAEIERRLADGRPFLMGEILTAPDLALAALAGPLLLPREYDGPLPALAELPSPMRAAVERWRVRPAGKFVLRLYASERPPRAPDLVALGKHGSGQTLKDKLANFLIGPGVLRPLFWLLRHFFPVLTLGKHAVISRYDDVVDVLKRDREFTISQINAEKINRIDGPFILGMDASPQYDRENAVLHQAVHREDLPAIREFVRQAACDLIAAARPQRRIDVVNGFARIVPMRLVAEYFGMPGPNDPAMLRWMRDIFHYIFANVTNDASVLRDALSSSAELRRHMDAQITLRKAQLAGQQPAVLDRLLATGTGGEASGSAGTVTQIDRRSAIASSSDENDDVLARLLGLQGPERPWFDDNAVRRNLGGVIVGAVDTTSKFVTLAMDELLRRPGAFAEAREAARQEDIETVRRYAWEAVRFNPHHPLQARFCGQETEIASGQSRAKTIPAGSSVYVGTLSAMFDPAVFTNPGEFNARREVEYLHFGYGMHACFGRFINAVQIPELVAALLRLPNLRRAPGSLGTIMHDGPFPDRLVLEFDA